MGGQGDKQVDELQGCARLGLGVFVGRGGKGREVAACEEGVWGERRGSGCRAVFRCSGVRGGGGQGALDLQPLYMPSCATGEATCIKPNDM